MSTREYLKRAFVLNTAIDSKIERVTKLRAMADALTDERPEVKLKILNMERELDRDIDRLIDAERVIERCIRAVSDERARTLLELRYLNRLSWEAISARMFLDIRWAQRLHNRAISIMHIPEAEQMDDEGLFSTQN